MSNGNQNDLKELLATIQAALNEAINLKITTVVGQVKDDLTVTNPKTMFTQIDLVQADITSKIDEAFVSGELQELRTYHQERERQANEIIDRNIQTLKSLAEYIQELLDQG